MHKYPTTENIISSLPAEQQIIWKTFYNEEKRKEENYQRKLRYHKSQTSLDANISKNSKFTSLHEIIASSSKTGLDYVLEREQYTLFEQFKKDLPKDYKIIFESMFENNMPANKACHLIGKSDKTAQKYYRKSLEYLYRKIVMYNDDKKPLC